MTPLHVILCAEGPSDDMLLPVIRWTIRQHLGADQPINDILATRSGSLLQKIESALLGYGGCDLLIIHRDADKAGKAWHTARVAEIDGAVVEVRSRGVPLPTHLHVVPVRMSEAWLLFDAPAIRRAAARERGKSRIVLPSGRYDEVANPKQMLREALADASELTGRKLQNFRRDYRPRNVANEIDDFSPLRKLSAFRLFETEIAAFAAQWKAEHPPESATHGP